MSWIVFLFVHLSYPSNAAGYTTTSLNLHQSPGGQVVNRLPANHSLKIVRVTGDWSLVEVNHRVRGYVKSGNVTKKWLAVFKKERQMELREGLRTLKTYSIALGGSPVADKVKQGDQATPLGRFYIAEWLAQPKPKTRYGARSMRLSYPNAEDARRGLHKGLINRKQYEKIIHAINSGEIPPQNTTLGGSIRIHGGGSGSDWTLGCIAMADQDIKELYSQLPKTRVRVEIYRSKKHFARSRSLELNGRVLVAAKEILRDKAKYTRKAMNLIPLNFPFGDFTKTMGVCTDIVIRSLRKVGIDLQSLVYEDIKLRPDIYGIKRADPNIDHRRTRNLQQYFLIRASPVKDQQWQPGDIVTMDTGIPNGTEFDHIGIVSDRKKNGIPLVINLWTLGYVTNEMQLIGVDYPKTVGHFRLKHPYAYGVE